VISPFMVFNINILQVKHFLPTRNAKAAKNRKTAACFPASGGRNSNLKLNL
jgi:hypothetical protein